MVCLQIPVPTRDRATRTVPNENEGNIKPGHIEGLETISGKTS